MGSLAKLGDLLGHAWPAERVVLGRRTCRWLRDRLLKLVDSVELLRMQNFELPDPVGVARDLRKFEWNKVVLRSWHERAAVLLVAMNCAEAGEFRNGLTRLDLGCARLSLDDVTGLSELLPTFPSLLSLGLNGNALRDTDVRLLSRGLQTSTALTTLLLENNSIGDAGLSAMAEVLPRCIALTQLSLLSNEISALGVQSLAAVLPCCSCLSDLNLRSNSKIQSQGALALASVLPQCEALTSLDLGWTGMMPGTAVAAVASAGVHLRRLALRGNSVDQHGVQALAKSVVNYKGLTSLDLSACTVGKGAAPLGMALRQCNALRELLLTDAKLGAGAPILYEALAHLSNLRVLNLSGAEVSSSERETEQLVNGLEGCSQLATLHLDANAVGGSVKVWSALRGRRRLRAVHVATNEISDLLVGALTEVLRTCASLTVLDLSHNAVGNAGAQALARLLTQCTELDTLAMRRNDVGDEGAGALAEVLKTERGRRGRGRLRLDLGANSIGDAGAEQMARALEAGSLVELSLSGNRVGRQGVTALLGALRRSSGIDKLNLGGHLADRQQLAALWRPGVAGWHKHVKVFL